MCTLCQSLGSIIGNVSVGLGRSLSSGFLYFLFSFASSQENNNVCGAFVIEICLLYTINVKILHAFGRVMRATLKTN